MKLLPFLLLPSLLIASQGVSANDYKLAYSEQYMVDVFTSNEDWCQDEVNITFKKQQESTTDLEIETLFKKVNKVIQSQCSEVSVISGNIVDINQKNSFKLSAKANESWIVTKTLPESSKGDDNVAAAASTSTPKVETTEALSEAKQEKDIKVNDTVLDDSLVDDSNDSNPNTVVKSEPSIDAPSIDAPSIDAPSIVEPTIVEPTIVEPSLDAPGIVEPILSTKSASHYEPEFAFYNAQDYKVFNENKDCAIYMHSMRKPDELDFLYWQTEEEPNCNNGFLEGEHTLTIQYIDGRKFLSRKASDYNNGFLLNDNIKNSTIKVISRIDKDKGWQNQMLMVHLGYLPNSNRPIYGVYRAWGNLVWDFKEVIVEEDNDDIFMSQEGINTLAKEIGAHYEEISHPYKYSISLWTNIVKKIEFDTLLAGDLMQYRTSLERRKNIWNFNSNSSENYVLQRVIDEKKALAEKERLEQKAKDDAEKALALQAEQEARRQKLIIENASAIETFVKQYAEFYDKVYISNMQVFNNFFQTYKTSPYESSFRNEMGEFPYNKVPSLMVSAEYNLVKTRKNKLNTFSIIQTGKSVDEAVNALAWPEHLYINKQSLNEKTWYLAFGHASYNENNNIVFDVEQTIECEKDKCDEYNDNDYVINKIANSQTIASENNASIVN